jgi:hypothetical protein
MEYHNLRNKLINDKEENYMTYRNDVKNYNKIINNEYTSLNEILVNSEHKLIKQKDFSTEKDNIEVYFKNIENIIIEKIKKYDIIIGCIAWLTNENILKELSKKRKF